MGRAQRNPSTVAKLKHDGFRRCFTGRSGTSQQRGDQLFIEPHLPVRRHRAVRPRHRLFQRMRLRALELRTGKSLSGAIVVKPSFARLEARDDRVTGRRVVFRCMLVWRSVAAADVTAFGTSAKMKPPPAGSRAFHTTCSGWLGCEVDAIRLRLHESPH